MAKPNDYEARWLKSLLDDFMRDVPLTEEQLAVWRETLAKEVDIKEFTCDHCSLRFSCELVFDAYNVEGDCLLEK